MANKKAGKPTDPKDEALAGDDRNVVVVDDDYSAASIEDQFIRFWDKNGVQVLIGIVVAIVAIVGYVAMGKIAEAREAEVSLAYGEALSQVTDDDISALNTFIAEHPDHRLAGLAFLQVGDHAVDDGDYSAALKAYKNASGLLEQPMLVQRARLAVAKTETLSGDRAAGKQAYTSIADDVTLLDAVRGEAAYQLMIINWEDGNFAAMQDRYDQIAALQYAAHWKSLAEQLRNNLPELNQPDLPVAGDEVESDPTDLLQGS